MKIIFYLAVVSMFFLFAGCSSPSDLLDTDESILTDGTSQTDQKPLPDVAQNDTLSSDNNDGAQIDTEGTVTTDVDNSGKKWVDQDSDSDGIPNGVECPGGDENNCRDSDKDGIPDYLDTDSDDDGISDKDETPNGALVDTDGDGTPDYLDTESDGDGIPDSVEGSGDADGDGIPNYRDKDSDNDGISDAVEAGADPNNPVDSDKDGTPDYLDPDSDGDGINDVYEGVKDSDGDGIPNYLDTDSDEDGVLDKDEGSLDGKPLDSDGDGFPNYLDHDSDNDGLTDSKEKEIGTDPKKIDTDGDGFDDNTEVAAGSDPLKADPEFYDGKFYVILPYQDPLKNDALKFETTIKKVDVMISLDLSGSMSPARDNLKADINNVLIKGISTAVNDPGFGISSFAGIEDSAFILNQPVTKDANAVMTAVNNLGGEGGGKIEAQYENLYQLASGAGLNAELLKFSTDFSSWVETFYEHYKDIVIPVKNCTGQIGSIGGGCFRNIALPVVIMITDEKLYDINSDLISDAGITRYHYKWGSDKPDKGHYANDVITAFNAVNAKFIGVIGEGVGDLLFDIEGQYKELADGTNSKGVGGEYFIFQTGYSGNGLSSEIVDAVKNLVANIQMDVNTSRESVANSYSIDTTQFIVDIIPSYSDPADSYQSKDQTTFYKTKPGINIFFDVTFKNDIFKPTTTENTLFRAKIQVLGEGALLDTRDVFIIVPGIKDDGGVES